jgi:hypothetical protein
MGSFPLPFECEERFQLLDASCEDAIALLPTSSRLQKSLWLWLPGLFEGPDNNEHVLHMAAHAGYRVLSIPWDTQQSASTRCAVEEDELTDTACHTGDTGDVLLLGGACDEQYDCANILHEELLTGIDDPRTPPDDTPRFFMNEPYVPGYEGRYWSGIERRATRALQALYEDDMADNSVNDHQWDAYCEPDDTHGSQLRWEEVVIAGMSMGATQAMHTYYTEPELTRIFTIEGFGDWCEVEPGSASTGEPAPYYYSDWSAGTFAEPPCGRKFSAFHWLNERWPQQDNRYKDSPQTYEPLGYSFNTLDEPHDYDTNGHSPVDGEVMVTSQEPVTPNGYHGSMAADDNLPKAYSGSQVAGDPGTQGSTGTESVYLFDGYLYGMCSLGNFR